MTVTWIDIQRGDRLSSMKPLDGQFLGNSAEHLAVKIVVRAMELKVFFALFGPFFLSGVVLKTPHLAAAPAGRDDVIIGLE